MLQHHRGRIADAAKVLGERSYLGRFNVLSQETVGPQVGDELQDKAMWAIVLSCLAMGIYIWIRFDLVFGVSAMICIIHDVAIAMAFHPATAKQAERAATAGAA